MKNSMRISFIQFYKSSKITLPPCFSPNKSPFLSSVLTSTQIYKSTHHTHKCIQTLLQGVPSRPRLTLPWDLWPHTPHWAQRSCRQPGLPGGQRGAPLAGRTAAADGTGLAVERAGPDGIRVHAPPH